MGATGESVRRLADFGFNPCWSPDGKQIVVATQSTILPFGRGAQSELWVIQLQTGERRRIATQDAVQSAWSPDGRWIAYWGIPKESAQRDLWIISASGGAPVQITNDAFTDWNPVWSPDGRYLYFSSDRGGTMSLWRFQIDQNTGKAIGEPEGFITPADLQRIQAFPNERTLLYAALQQRSNIMRIAFDPVSAH